MLLRHIVTATDESDAGRQAVRTAAVLASRASARLTILRVIAVEATRRLVRVGAGAASVDGDEDAPALIQLRRWLQADVLSPEVAAQAHLGVAYGIPGIEICRFAERVEADLLVLGRKRHSPMMRLLLGDTADAVARRSRFPCLFVPPGCGEIRNVLAALDGTDRGLSVLIQAGDFARQTGAAIETVTVERKLRDEPPELSTDLPAARSMSLQGRVREILARDGFPEASLTIRRGEIVEQVIAQAQETQVDGLAIGYHRGGPPGVLEAGSTARRLAHAAPCAVLTIPL